MESTSARRISFWGLGASPAGRTGPLAKFVQPPTAMASAKESSGARVSSGEAPRASSSATHFLRRPPASSGPSARRGPARPAREAPAVFQLPPSGHPLQPGVQVVLVPLLGRVAVGADAAGGGVLVPALGLRRPTRSAPWRPPRGSGSTSARCSRRGRRCGRGAACSGRADRMTWSLGCITFTLPVPRAGGQTVRALLI